MLSIGKSAQNTSLQEEHQEKGSFGNRGTNVSKTVLSGKVRRDQIVDRQRRVRTGRHEKEQTEKLRDRPMGVDSENEQCRQLRKVQGAMGSAWFPRQTKG